MWPRVWVCPTSPLPTNSYSKDYDPEDWLQVDGATGRIQTQRVLSPASPFLKDGWYRAIILALDNGEGSPCPGWHLCPTAQHFPLWTDKAAYELSPPSSRTTQHSHRHPVH